MFYFLLEQFCNSNKDLSYMNYKTGGKDLPLSIMYKLMWITTLNICNIYRHRKMINKDYLTLINNLIKDCTYTYKTSKMKEGLNYSKDTIDKIRLYKSIYYLKLENYPGIEINEHLNTFLDEFKPFICMNYENITHVSKLQKSVGDILKEMNIEFELEKKTEFCSVDYFIKPNIIIEVNGPGHYVSFSNQLKTKHILTRRVLKLIGYNCIDIYYKDMVDVSFVKTYIENELKLIKNKKF